MLQIIVFVGDAEGSPGGKLRKIMKTVETGESWQIFASINMKFPCPSAMSLNFFRNAEELGCCCF